uniref:Uncharacterized protein n=1 Tax=Megaselia scalaris TaxID=36166 RepID=T1GWW0_MEGSC
MIGVEDFVHLESDIASDNNILGHNRLDIYSDKPGRSGPYRIWCNLLLKPDTAALNSYTGISSVLTLLWFFKC